MMWALSPNQGPAAICVRCGVPMVVVEPPPPPMPAPVYVAPPPEPVFIDEPRGVPWWVWVLLGTGFVVIITLIVLALTGVLG